MAPERYLDFSHYDRVLQMVGRQGTLAPVSSPDCHPFHASPRIHRGRGSTWVWPLESVGNASSDGRKAKLRLTAECDIGARLAVK